MKRISCIRKVIFSLFFLLLFHAAVWSQVRFDADFESGSLGNVERLDSVCVVVSPGDTVLHLSYRIDGHFDPANPIDTALAPSANWYYFRMTGIGGKQIYLTTPDFGVAGYSYSYDGFHWEHLPLAEAPRHRLDKRFDRDTVYLALYNPYTYSYLQERLRTWCERPDVTLDEKVLRQAMRYNSVLDVRYLVVTNGNLTYLYRLEGGVFVPCDRIPAYEEMVCQR